MQLMEIKQPMRLPLGKGGFAIVIVLGLVVLITVIILALFAKAQFGRISERTATGGVQVGLLAQSAIAAIADDLRVEMHAGSALIDEKQQSTVMRPAAPQSVVPSRVVMQTISEDPHFVNLLKQSGRGLPTFSATNELSYPRVESYPAVTRASAVSTADPSKNERWINPERWNMARLTMGDGFVSTNQVPDWVLMARAGIKNDVKVWSSDLGDAKPDNPNYVIGRYAYQIYDIGGLLDANAAGFPPEGFSEDLVGTLAGIDLESLGDDAPGGQFFSWRNPGSSADYSETVLSILLNKGFLEGGSRHRLLSGRRDLLKLAEKQGFEKAMPFLTHFTREVNAPSAGPLKNASELGGNNGPNNVYAYRDRSDSTMAVNPFFQNIRVKKDGDIVGYDDEGQARTRSVHVGEPLINRRFSLAKLGWIGPNGPQNGGTEAAIRTCFGLMWDGNKWIYTGSEGPGSLNAVDRIKTLDEISNEASLREPNFFELLQAAILNGSLGLDNGGYQSSKFYPYEFQESYFLQLLTIGANIIDQYDRDSYPTIIVGSYLGKDIRVAGSENLPYLAAYKEAAGKSPNSGSAHAHYLLVVLWAPYGEGESDSDSDVPPIRVRIEGGFQQSCGWSPNASAAYPFELSPGFVDAAIQLNPSRYADFREKTPLTAENTIGADPVGSDANKWQELPAMGDPRRFVGLRFPDVEVSEERREAVKNAPPEANRGPNHLISRLGFPSDPFVIVTEFQSASGEWQPYGFSSGVDDVGTWRSGNETWVGGSFIARGGAVEPNPWTQVQLNELAFNYKVDPRATRFNELKRDTTSATDALFLRHVHEYMASNSMRFTPKLFGSNQNADWSPASLAFNNGSKKSDSYRDVDGVQRFADYGLFPGDSWQNSPYQGANRPVVLNRPFRSVSEMGRAFRDLPWKSLDFFTERSGDAGLLDVFSIVDEPPVRAGVINLNTRNVKVLSAMLQNDQLGQALVDRTQTTPLVSRADLSSVAEKAFSSLGSAKTQREDALRRMSEAGQVRTWNLFVDLIVQSGRYPANASALEDFLVEGEKHFWWSVAIDRYTGEIVDQILETAYEY